MTEIPKIFDSYNRHARLYPALLTVSPVLAIGLAWFPALFQQSVGGAIVGIAGACGVMYLLSDFARSRGKSIEPQLLDEWGGWPTTIWLRHRDTNLPALTKARYHAFLGMGALGQLLPTVESEQIDPVGADQKYASAVGWLKEQSRGAHFQLVEKENATYGFRRNMLGMKPIGIVLCFLAIAVALVVLVSADHHAAFSWASALQFAWAAPRPILIAVAFAVVALAMWLLVVTREWVHAAGDQYARALLATCERPN